MSHNLNFLKGIIYGTTIRVTKGSTRTLDYGSCSKGMFVVKAVRVVSLRARCLPVRQG